MEKIECTEISLKILTFIFLITLLDFQISCVVWALDQVKPLSTMATLFGPWARLTIDLGKLLYLAIAILTDIPVCVETKNIEPLLLFYF